MARRAASEHGVSEAASAPLIWIGRLGENVRQTALAEAIGIEGASLVRLLDELQGSGLITREQDPNDRRANAVNLTPRGREVLEEVTEALAQLPPEDAETVVRVLRAIEAAAGSADR